MAYSESLWLYAALVFGIIVVPGMDMLYVLTNALTGGRPAGMSATGGIMLGGVFHTLFGVTGIALILKTAPTLFSAMLLAGGLYMAWIGVSLLRSSITVDTLGRMRRRSLPTAFRQGFVTSVLNPKAYLFVIAVMPQVVRPEFGPLWRQALAIGFVTVTMQLAVYGGLAFAAGQSRDFLTSRPNWTIAIGRIAGGLFIAAAVWTAWHALAAA